MYFNPLDKHYKSITGAVCINKEITFRVKGDFDSVVFMLKKDLDNEYKCFSMKKNGNEFAFSLSIEETGLYWYKFKINDNLFIGLGEDFTGVLTGEPIDFQLTIYSAGYSTPSWLSGGIIYQIFPDRFNAVGETKPIKNRVIHQDKSDTPIFLPDEKGIVQNNDFFGGNLQGIIDKLDYLKELNVSVIYLNPIFKAYSNHRYDTGNYMEIDPMLGTIEDFNDLVKKANEKDIKIVLDGVFNHTGDDSLYFNKYGNYDEIGAFQDKNSKYFNWYQFKKYPEDYESWWGIKTLPATNKNCSEYIDYITGKGGVLEYYTSLGIGGWRLDVVDELPAYFVEKIRDRVKKINPNAVIIGEVWEDASNKIAYGVRRRYFQGKELDSVMNYPLKDAILSFVKYGDSERLSLCVKEQIDHHPYFVLDSLMNILSTHDTFRLISAVADVDVEGKTKLEMDKIILSENQLKDAKFRVKIASLLQYTLYGVPSIYYGDEIGMQGYKDPLNRKFFTWNNIDDELHDWFVSLGELRSKFSAFAQGETCEIFSKKGTYVFKRCNDFSQLLICVNVGLDSYKLSFEGVLTDYFSKETYQNLFELKPRSFAVLYTK